MSDAWRWSSSGHQCAANDADGMSTADRVEDRMLTLLKRHQVQTLLAAEHDQVEVARPAGVSERSVRRIVREAGVEHVDDRQERKEHRIGRPSKVEAFRPLVQELVEEVDEEKHSPLKSVEILRRARLEEYEGGKSALYELIVELRHSDHGLHVGAQRPPPSAEIVRGSTRHTSGGAGACGRAASCSRPGVGRAGTRPGARCRGYPEFGITTIMPKKNKCRSSRVTSFPTNR